MEAKGVLTGGFKELQQEPFAFVDFLGYLVARMLGGTHITEYIANLIKDAGADGFIFPSARHDTLVKYNEEGELDAWMGWNFVDYAGLGRLNSRAGAWFFEDVTYFNTMVGSIELDPEIFKNPHCYTVQSWGLHRGVPVSAIEASGARMGIATQRQLRRTQIADDANRRENAMAWLCRRPKAAETR